MHDPGVTQLDNFGSQDNCASPSGPPPLPHLRDRISSDLRGSTKPVALPINEPARVDESTGRHEAIAVSSKPRSAGIEGFLEAFLQERNIKWMLGLGVLMLLGSSLMFVVQQWQTMGAFWQYTVLLSYTGIIHLCGQAAYHRFGLRKTGTGLMSLTLLLIPLGFFSLKWITAGSGAQAMAFLVPTTIFSSLATRRIFKHFLHADRPSVLASYLVLSLMGAVAPTLVQLVPLQTLWLFATWLVFAFGSVKANREVFWLVEEHRKPRIFGFFPIALFGLQFLAVFVLHFRSALSVQQLGFGCVLTAIPILMTADAIAGVFRQRTGDLVRPLPWPIIGPVVVGLIVSVIGLVLSAVGGVPYALVPSSAMFAIMMGTIAHRTEKRGFTWAMLFGVVMAYQFSPVFFRELAMSVVHQAAIVVRERRLPLPLYGLTYMPLLFACSLAARFVRGRKVFAEPLQYFTMGLSTALFAISFLHPKAIFLVPAVMSAFFLWQAFCFRRTEPSTLAIVAAITAVARAVPYVNDVSNYTLPAELGIWLLGGLALACQLLGRSIDSIIARRAGIGKPIVLGWKNASLPTTAIAAAAWVALMLPTYAANPALMSGIMLVTLLGGQALMSPNRGFGESAFLFALFLTGLHLSALRLAQPGTIMFVEAAALFVLWGFGRLTEHRTDRMAMAFSSAARHVSLLLLPICAVSILWSVVGYGVLNSGFRWGFAASGTIGAIWCFGAGPRYRLMTTVGFINLLALQVPLMGEFIELQWVPVAWAATCFVTLIGSQNLTTDSRSDLTNASLVVLTLIAAVSLVFFTMPLAIASGIAVVAFFLQTARANSKPVRELLLVVLNWQLLSLLLRVITGHDGIITDMKLKQLGEPAALPMVAALATSFAFFGHRARTRQAGKAESSSVEALLEVQKFATACLAGLFLLFSLASHRQPLDVMQWLCVAIAFAAPAISEFRLALQTQRSSHVWGVLACVGVAIVYLKFLGAFTLGPVTMFAAMFLAVPAALVAKATREHGQGFIAGPMTKVARLLPVVTVGIAFVRFFTAPHAFALNSLAALMAAAYYFWCGIEEKNRGLVVFAAAIANAVWFAVCLQQEFIDPQFFLVPVGFSTIGLVELLKREIPQSMRNPLRYAGALMILISPAFNLIGGNWLQLLSLMVFSVLVALAAIGLRARPLLYTGTAFLVFDIVAMVWKGVNTHHELLWLGGLLAGGSVIALAALFENHREKLLSQVRLVTTKLQSWD